MSKLLTFREDAYFYLYRRPVKMFRSFDGLEALIRTEMDKGLASGDIFIFLNRTRSMLKALVYEQRALAYFTHGWMKARSSCCSSPVTTRVTATSTDQLMYI